MVLNMQMQSLSLNSSYQNTQSAAVFNMTTGEVDRELYVLPADSESGVVSFLANDPQFEVEPGVVTSLIPEDPENLRLAKVIDDREQRYLTDNDIRLESKHYFFEQMRCGNVPVFAGNMHVHTSGNNGVYALSGALTKNDVDCSQKINEEQAASNATSQFLTDIDEDLAVEVVENRLYIFDENLISDDLGGNIYLVHYVEVCDETGFCRGYMVETQNGEIVFDFQISSDALNRRVTRGSTTRTEQSGPSGNQQVDDTFDILGSTYNYFNTTHQRDSYDDRGGEIIAQIPSCSDNASWNGRYITICSQLVASDVIAHEYQHAVTQYAVGGQSLIYQNESGALNESLSDVFGFALDSDDWTLGETTALGAIRSMSNPPSKGHPDRMFSSRYYCGGADGGGVHVNSGVFNKAFYLMIEGGSFNGCNITGFGVQAMDKAHLVVYRALSTYLQGKNSANYRDMYDAMTQACNDVHGSGSPECGTITAAMQAVEMDQQQSGKAKGPKCSGTQAQPATCTGNQPQPTGSTSPTTQPGQPTTQPTTQPQPTAAPAQKKVPLQSSVSAPQSATGDVELDYDGSIYRLTSTISENSFDTFFNREGFAGVPVRGELIGPDIIDTGSFQFENGSYVNRFSSGKDLTQYHTYQVVAINETGDEIPFLLGDLGATTGGNPDDGSADPQNVRLDLKLRFQGIDKIPNATEAILVRVGVGGGDLPENIYKYALFTPGEGGAWTGSVDFDVEPGNDYKVLIKGPKHSQRRICENAPTEAEPGLYKCDTDSITLALGSNDLDFSGVIMLGGDLPPEQDGIVNSRDVLTIRRNLNKSDFEALAVADINYDGVVNSVDDALVVFTLSNRTDKN